jgi:hypothetical protein
MILHPRIPIRYWSGGENVGWEESLTALVALATAVLTAIKMFWEIRKDRRTTLQLLDVIKNLRANSQSNREELGTLKEAFGNNLTISSQEALTRRQNELRVKDEEDWNRLVDTAKGIGWFPDKARKN